MDGSPRMDTRMDLRMNPQMDGPSGPDEPSKRICGGGEKGRKGGGGREGMPARER